MLASIPAAREPDTGGLEVAGTSLGGHTDDHHPRRSSVRDVDGLRLAYRQYGAEHGGVPLVLLTRCQGTIDDWDPEVLSRLTARRR
jgi:hypothetical protein